MESEADAWGLAVSARRTAGPSRCPITGQKKGEKRNAGGSSTASWGG